MLAGMRAMLVDPRAAGCLNPGQCGCAVIFKRSALSRGSLDQRAWAAEACVHVIESSKLQEHLGPDLPIKSIAGKPDLGSS